MGADGDSSDFYQTVVAKRIAQLGVSLTAQAHEELRDRFNVAGGGPEVHYAEAQSVLSGDHSIGDECLAALLNGCQQALIQLVQIISVCGQPRFA